MFIGDIFMALLAAAIFVVVLGVFWLLGAVAEGIMLFVWWMLKKSFFLLRSALS